MEFSCKQVHPHLSVHYSIIFQDQTESAAILKIKESMQEEAKRFEKDTPSEGGSHSDYFGMQ